LFPLLDRSRFDVLFLLQALRRHDGHEVLPIYVLRVKFVEDLLDIVDFRFNPRFDLVYFALYGFN